MRNLYYRIMFWLRKLPDISEVKEPKDPKGKIIIPEVYMMSGVTIGNLPWNGPEWKRIYQKGIDPEFKAGFPWDSKGEGSPDNVEQNENGLDVIGRKEEGLGTYGHLWSNFDVKYGFIRSKVKLPSVRGSFPAFWTFDGMPESDIFEHCGQWNNKVTATHHWGYDYNQPTDRKYGKKATRHNERTNRKFRPTQNYYIYELEISPYKLTWRINGRIVRVMKKGIPSSRNHILYTVAKGSYCGVSEYSSLIKDAHMNIEWLKIYKTTD